MAIEQTDITGVNDTLGPLTAGNTTTTLSNPTPAPSDGTPSAADLDDVAKEAEIKAATSGETDEENLFDVSRAEFSELQDAYLGLAARVAKFNLGSPHKI